MFSRTRMAAIKYVPDEPVLQTHQKMARSWADREWWPDELISEAGRRRRETICDHQTARNWWKVIKSSTDRVSEVVLCKVSAVQGRVYDLCGNTLFKTLHWLDFEGKTVRNN
mgnify:CR=1 FL=1